MEQSEAYLKAKKAVEERRGLYAHTLVYLIVNTMLFGIDFFTPGGPWFYWPLFGWGIGLLIHLTMYFSGLTPGSEAEERAIQKYMQTHQR